MKNIFYIVTFILISCKGDPTKSVGKSFEDQKKARGLHERSLNRSCLDFMAFSKSYQLKDVNVDMNINDSLKKYDLIYLSKDRANSTCFEEGVFVIFLREYAHHLEMGSPGFDLKSMCRGESNFIFNYFVNNVGLDSTIEFLQSGYVVDALSSSKNYLRNNVYIDSIYQKIRKLESQMNRRHNH